MVLPRTTVANLRRFRYSNCTCIHAKTYHIEIWGCQMNVADAAAAARRLESLGMSEVPDPADADLVLLETCCVREKPEHKIYSRLGEAAPVEGGAAGHAAGGVRLHGAKRRTRHSSARRRSSTWSSGRAACIACRSCSRRWRPPASRKSTW